MISAVSYGNINIWINIVILQYKTNLHMVGDMSIHCSTISCGAQSTGVYSLQYHLVWCTKYRKKVLRDGIDTECREMLEEMAGEYKFTITAMEVMPDHIHLLVDCRPQFYIPDMIKIMKGNLARRLFIRHPELRKELWRGHLWNPSYCAVTVSDRSREQVERYILTQKDRA